jgi:NAD(P)-dependent dehydrogenase (short-subunit alcohol dehydrogenase family)
MADMRGKTAIVTGGTSGIGRATAGALARAGVNVVFTGRREGEGKTVEGELAALARAHGARAIFVQGDVTDEAHVQHAVQTAAGITGKLHYAFNNAGVELAGVSVADSTPEQYRKVFDTNVLGVLLSMKHEIRAMTAPGNGGGSIVNTASIAASIGMPNAGVYIASKHAVLGFTRSAALETAKSGVRINCVSPAAIDTDMLSRFTGNRDPQAVAWLTGLHPVGRLGTPEEIARPVLFLLSDDSSYVTGHDLRVDGAFTVQ